MALLPASITKGGELTNGMMRNTNAAAAPGKTGIDEPSDFLGRALGSSWQVSIDPGSGIIANTYALAEYRQSYRVANDAASDDALITVPQAGSGSARTDYLILRVYDPEFAGQTDPSGKGCGLSLVSSLPTGYPHMPLYKITQPAGNTAGIQQTMLTDLRQVANPQNLLVSRSIPAVSDDTGMTLNNTNKKGEFFPNGEGNNLGPTTIAIPEWAVKAQIECWWLGVKYAASSNANGRYWVEWGPQGATTSDRTYSTQKFAFDAPNSSTMRTNWILSDYVSVPYAMRGTSQLFVPKAGYWNGTTGVSMDALSGIAWKVRFFEVADPEVR